MTLIYKTEMFLFAPLEAPAKLLLDEIFCDKIEGTCISSSRSVQLVCGWNKKRALE